MGEPAFVLMADGVAAGAEARDYQALRERVAALRTPCFWPALPGRPPLSLAERAGLIRLAGTIRGRCGEAKLAAMIQALRFAPAGDVVEIGCGPGRSAAALAWLAGRYDIGQVLCIDRWAGADEALQAFEINLAPLARGRLNYLRMGPAEAAAVHGAGAAIATETFGQTRCAGAVAVLHIAAADEADTADACGLWTPRVAQGGWVVFDDYEQGFGEARRRAADAFVEREAGHLAARFTAGGSLFVQLAR